MLNMLFCARNLGVLPPPPPILTDLVMERAILFQHRSTPFDIEINSYNLLH